MHESDFAMVMIATFQRNLNGSVSITTLFSFPFCRTHLIYFSLWMSAFLALKKAMSSRLSRLYATEISRLHKTEWQEYYAKACSFIHSHYPRMQALPMASFYILLSFLLTY